MVNVSNSNFGNIYIQQCDSLIDEKIGLNCGKILHLYE